MNQAVERDDFILPGDVAAFTASLDPLRKQSFEHVLSQNRSSQAFMDYVKAFIRLLDNQPVNDPELCERAGEERIKVTLENVAKEAGRKRSRISGPRSDFAALGAFIKTYRPTHGVLETTTERLAEAARTRARLEHRITVLQSKAAEAHIRVEQLETENRDLRRQIARIKR